MKRDGTPHQAHLDKMYNETDVEKLVIKVMKWTPNDLTTPFVEGEYIFNSNGIRQWTPDNSIKIFDPYNNNSDAIVLLRKCGDAHPLSLITDDYLDSARGHLSSSIRHAICKFALDLIPTKE